MNSISNYSLYGLCIRSELPLTAAVAPDSSLPDLTIHLGEGLSAQAAPPVGEVWAKADFGNGFGVQLTKTAEGWSLFYPQTGEFRFGGDLRFATAHALPGRDEILPLLLLGSVPAWWLNLQGEAVLHASAVSVGGGALAFIGASGMGKSTLATLLCSAGASLVTDDVLRLKPEGGNLLTHWGTGELRLRPNAASLSELFTPESVSRSSDGRTTLLLSAKATALPRLRAIVIPQPLREQSELSVERLSAVEAGFYLNGYARVYGWRVESPMRRQFVLFAALAAQIPLYRARIPWGPPFASGLPQQLAEACGLDWTSCQPSI